MARPYPKGRLVVGERPPPSRRFRWWLLLPLAVALVALALWPPAWLRAQFVPRKLVVRGCVLTTAPAVLGTLSATGEETYLELWRWARGRDLSQERWLQSVALVPAWGRAAVLTVRERQPVLRVVGGGNKYWLCDDGRLVYMDVENDFGGVFAAIRKLPSIDLARDPGQGPLPLARELLLSAACLEEVLAGVIKTIAVNEKGEFTLYDHTGFPVRLGAPKDLRRKIGALEKALRSCADDRRALRYLDASELPVFYEKWKEPLQ